jgi:hypothetical protein
MQAWSRANMFGDQSYFMNALLTCLDDEEEKTVTRTRSLNIFVHTSVSSLLNVNIVLSNFFSLFIPSMILIHPLLTKIEKNGFRLHLHSCICELLAAGCICNSAFLHLHSSIPAYVSHIFLLSCRNADPDSLVDEN